MLTRRIAHLIASKRARPEQILALTFTDKAAVEMAERVDQLIPYGYAETWIGTFHAFGDHVLRESSLEVGLNPEFRVLTRPEQIIFLRERLWRLPLQRYRPLGDPTQHLAALLTLVSRAKDEDVSPERYREWAEARRAAATTDEDVDEAERHLEVAAFYATYQTLLAEAGAADFGDQISRALALLRARPALLGTSCASATATCWWTSSRTRTTRSSSSCASWRGRARRTSRSWATTTRPSIAGAGRPPRTSWPSGSMYPGAREVVLTENHRSTQVILDAAARLIAYNNPYRLEVMAGIDKRLRSARPPGPRSAISTSTPSPPRPTRWPDSSRIGSPRASGRATSRSSCAATATPIPSCAPST